jgi:hypothetical protein
MRACLYTDRRRHDASEQAKRMTDHATTTLSHGVTERLRGSAAPLLRDRWNEATESASRRLSVIVCRTERAQSLSSVVSRRHGVTEWLRSSARSARSVARERAGVWGWGLGGSGAAL